MTSADPPAGLGAGLAHRVRPRLGSTRRPGRSAGLGTVARRSTSFGLGIGRAASARPRVEHHRTGLGTASIRPPRGAWSWGRDDHVDDRLDTWVDDRRDDRPAPPPPAEPAPLPEFGDRKVDALRRLLRGGTRHDDSSTTAPPSAPEARTSGGKSGATSARSDPPPSIRRSTPAAPGGTMAGPATGPGQLGRRLRPEAAPARDGVAMPTASAPAPAPTTTARPADASAPAPSRVPPEARPARRGPARRSAAEAVAALKRTVAARHGDRGPGTAAPPPHATDRAAPAARPATPDDTGRPGPSTAAGPSSPAGPSGPAGPSSVTGAPSATGTRAPAHRRPDSGDGTTSGGGTTPRGTDAPGGDERGDIDVLPLATDPARAAIGTATVRRARIDDDLRLARTITAHGVAEVGPLETPRPPAATESTTTGHGNGTTGTATTGTAIGTATTPSPAAVPPPAAVRRSIDRRRRSIRTPMADLATRTSLPHTRSDRHRPSSTLVDAMVRRRLTGTAIEPGTAVAPAPAGLAAPPAAPRGAPAEQPAAGIDPRHDQPAATPTRHPTVTPSNPTGPSNPASPSNPPGGANPADAVTTAEAGTRITLLRPGSLFAGHPATATTNATTDTPTITRPAGRRSIVAPGPGALQRVVDRSAPAAVDAPSREYPTAEPPTARRAAAPAVPAPAAPTPPVRAPGAAPEVTSRPVADHPATDHPAASPAVVRPAARGEALAQRFLAALSQAPPPRPTPLPRSFSPMAEAITGQRTVMFSTDDSSRRALRSVGKRAATTDDVIHLARAPVRPDARTTEVVAHELTHVAHPSPEPRFFDDDHRGPEERRAEQIGRIMARAPLGPSSPAARRSAGPSGRPGRSAGGDTTGGGSTEDGSTEGGSTGISRGAAPTVRRRGDRGVVRRSPARGGGITADELATRVTGRDTGRDTGTPSRAGSGNGGRGHTIRRRAAGAGTPSAVSSGGSSAGGAGRSGTIDPENTPRNSTVADELSQLLDSPEGREWFREQLKHHIDLVVRALEDHVIVELERRGGRSWGNL